MTIAIVGAGVAGLACAARLAEHGVATVLFDKGKRPGGRLSTLQVDGMAWDFGCPAITPISADFAQQARQWMEEGLLGAWPDGPPGALVGRPAMGSLIAAQCAHRAVRFGAQVDRLTPCADGWMLGGLQWIAGPYSAVVVAVPAEQAAPLLSLHDLPMAREAASVRSQPCWTAMIALPAGSTGGPDWLQDRGPIAWAARRPGSTPDDTALECWVVQAKPEWSRLRIDVDRQCIADALIATLANELGHPLPPPVFAKAHRWRFARVVGARAGAQWKPALGLGACGDWCLPGEVEGAWRSGRDLADRIVQDAGAAVTANVRRAAG